MPVNVLFSGLKNDSDSNKIHAARKRKKCSRKRLEKLLLEKSEQLIQAHGDIEKLQASCQELKSEVKDWKAKSDSLAKTCSKLATKLKTDLGSNGKISKDIKRVNDNKDKKRKLSEYDDSKEEHKKLKVDKDLVALKRKNVKDNHENQAVAVVKPFIDVPELPNPADPKHSWLLKPNLSLKQTEKGLEVLWEFGKSFDEKLLKYYELFTFKSNSKPGTSWKKLTNINSMKLPIKVTLSDFKSGSTYFYARGLYTVNLRGLYTVKFRGLQFYQGNKIQNPFLPIPFAF